MQDTDPNLVAHGLVPSRCVVALFFDVLGPAGISGRIWASSGVRVFEFWADIGISPRTLAAYDCIGFDVLSGLAHDWGIFRLLWLSSVGPGVSASVLLFFLVFLFVVLGDSEHRLVSLFLFSCIGSFLF